MTSGDPLGLDPATMRRLGYQAGRHARRDPLRPHRARRYAAPPRTRWRSAWAVRRPDGPGEFSAILDAPREGRAAVSQPGRPSGLLRVRPLVRDLARGAGRPDRQRLQHLRRLVDGVGRTEPARARGAGLVQGLDRAIRPSPQARSSPAARRPTSPRWPAPARRWRRRDGRPPRGLPVRSGPFLARPGGTPARLRPRPGAGASHRRRSTFRLEPATVAAAMAADRAAGRTPALRGRERGRDEHRRGRPAGGAEPPCAASAACGCTPTRPTAASPSSPARGRDQLPGLEQADSVTLDPHKWLLPVLRVRLPARAGRPRSCDAPSRSAPTTCATPRHERTEVNFSDLGLQLTRASRAFKLWVSLRYFGLDAFRAAIDRTLDLAALARRRVEAEPGARADGAAVPRNRLLPPHLRRSDDPEEIDRGTRGSSAQLEREGFAVVSSTRLGGRYAIRLCVLNHTTRADDVERTLRFLENAEQRGDRRSPCRLRAMETALQPLSRRLGRGQLEPCSDWRASGMRSRERRSWSSGSSRASST